MSSRLVCFLLLLHWRPGPTSSQPTRAPVDIVYRADTLTPDEVKRRGGFWPRGMDHTHPAALPADFSLFNHVQGTADHCSADCSGFVSTTASENFAEQHLLDRLDATGFVYSIHVSENIIDVSASLGRHYQHPDEEEFAAIAGIRWAQIMGWTEYRNGEELRWTPNPDYQADFFSSRTSGGAQPQLADFPAGHPAWLEEPWNFVADCSPGNSKRHQASNCVARHAALDVGLNYLAQVMRFDSLRLRVELSDDFTAGTDDAICAKLGRQRKCIPIFDGPSRRQIFHRDIDLMDVFGRSVVSLQELDAVFLIQAPLPHPIASDDFKLKGIWVTIRLADTGRWLRNTQHASVNQWLGTQGSMPTSVWNGALNLKDWTEVGLK